VAWGDWVGAAGLVVLALLGVAGGWRSARAGGGPAAPRSADPTAQAAAPIDVAVLPPAARVAAGLLRAFARGSLLAMGAAMVLGDAMQAGAPTHLRLFAGLFIVPEAAAWCVLRAFAARASIGHDSLVLARGARRLALARRDVVGVEAWRLPLPGEGAALRLASGARWRYGLALADPGALARRLGVPLRAPPEAPARWAVRRGLLDRPWAKFGLLPLALAVPAFRLHQHIAYGSAFGELQTFGLKAYAATFAIWWGEWVIGVALCAAALRAGVEAASGLGARVRPARAAAIRRALERLALAALYLGLPAWLTVRALGG
jgi:apolipoprotein N-acyltransferase